MEGPVEADDAGDDDADDTRAGDAGRAPGGADDDLGGEDDRSAGATGSTLGGDADGVAGKADEASDGEVDGASASPVESCTAACWPFNSKCALLADMSDRPVAVCWPSASECAPLDILGWSVDVADGPQPATSVDLAGVGVFEADKLAAFVSSCELTTFSAADAGLDSGSVCVPGGWTTC